MSAGWMVTVEMAGWIVVFCVNYENRQGAAIVLERNTT